MNRSYIAAFLTAPVLALFSLCAEGESNTPIERVDIRAGRAFHVNGKPFFPIMSWLQDAKNFPAVRDCGMNTTAGYYPRSSGTQNVKEYLALVEEAGLYGVMPFDAALINHPALLAYIHGDEPDLPRRVSEAKVEPAEGMRINRKTPLWKLLDGDMSSWSVFDPLDGSEVTIRLAEPVTVNRLAVWLTVSKSLPLAKVLRFEGDGKPILEATLEAKKGRQQFDLPGPVTFSRLKMTVTATVPGEQVWGSFAEIEGFDETGKNVLLSPPRTVPRTRPEETLKIYQAIKAADTSRPVFMTFTGNFHPFFKKWGDDQQSLYPDFIRAADVVGYDIYPIYGWNKPQWIHLVHEGTERLVELAQGRPVYAWIETSKGGQYTGPLERQKNVTPTHIRAEVWMAICRGATAIGYFTHVWKPRYNQFGVPDENRKALLDINRQITRLTPDILGRVPELKVNLKTEGNAKVDLMAKETDAHLVMFAVNYDEQLKKAEVTIEVEGLAEGAIIEVIDENRTIQANEGSFTDTFAPLAVHHYRVNKPSS